MLNKHPNGSRQKKIEIGANDYLPHVNDDHGDSTQATGRTLGSGRKNAIQRHGDIGGRGSTARGEHELV